MRILGYFYHPDFGGSTQVLERVSSLSIGPRVEVQNILRFWCYLVSLQILRNSQNQLAYCTFCYLYIHIGLVWFLRCWSQTSWRRWRRRSKWREWPCMVAPSTHPPTPTWLVPAKLCRGLGKACKKRGTKWMELWTQRIGHVEIVWLSIYLIFHINHSRLTLLSL